MYKRQEHALTLSQIQSKVDEGCFDMVMPVDGVFENLPAVHTASAVSYTHLGCKADE